MKHASLLLILSALLALVSCGPPGEVLMENKDVKPRAAGSFIRLVNLSPKQVRIMRGNANIGFWVEPNDYSEPMITRSGKVTVNLLTQQSDQSEKSVPVEFEFVPQSVHTMVVFPDGSHVLTEAEPVKSVMDKEVVVRVAALGKAAAELSKPVKVMIGGSEVSVTKNEDSVRFKGDIEVVGLTGEPKGSTDSKWASTILIVDNKGLKGFVFRNGKDVQPISNATSASG